MPSNASFTRRAEITPDLEPVVDRIQSWMRHKTGDEIQGILENLAGAGPCA